MINNFRQIKHNFLTIYCHNISGAKTKIPRINELLTKSPFNIIAFQETWFDQSIEDFEQIKNTNFNIIRQDRHETSHPKKVGWGVALLLRSEIKYKRHSFDGISILQYIYISIFIESSKIVLVNIYSPFGLVPAANLELTTLLKEVEKLDRTDVIIVGDFNMPLIKWIPDEEFPGVFLPFGNESTESFTNFVLDHNLLQIIGPLDDRNHLDLAFVTDINSCHYTHPIIEEFL